MSAVAIDRETGATFGRAGMIAHLRTGGAAFLRHRHPHAGGDGADRLRFIRGRP